MCFDRPADHQPHAQPVADALTWCLHGVGGCPAVGGSFGQPDGGHEWKTKAHKVGVCDAPDA